MRLSRASLQPASSVERHRFLRHHVEDVPVLGLPEDRAGRPVPPPASSRSRSLPGAPGPPRGTGAPGPASTPRCRGPRRTAPRTARRGGWPPRSGSTDPGDPPGAEGSAKLAFTRSQPGTRISEKSTSTWSGGPWLLRHPGPEERIASGWPSVATPASPGGAAPGCPVPRPRRCPPRGPREALFRERLQGREQRVARRLPQDRREIPRPVLRLGIVLRLHRRQHRSVRLFHNLLPCLVHLPGRVPAHASDAPPRHCAFAPTFIPNVP